MGLFCSITVFLFPALSWAWQPQIHICTPDTVTFTPFSRHSNTSLCGAFTELGFSVALSGHCGAFTELDFSLVLSGHFLNSPDHGTYPLFLGKEKNDPVATCTAHILQRISGMGCQVCIFVLVALLSF